MILPTRIPAVIEMGGKPPESGCIIAIAALPPGLPFTTVEAWMGSEGDSASALKPVLTISHKTGRIAWFGLDEVRGATDADLARFQEIEALEAMAKASPAPGTGSPLVAVPDPNEGPVNPTQAVFGFLKDLTSRGPLFPKPFPKSYRKKVVKKRRKKK